MRKGGFGSCEAAVLYKEKTVDTGMPIKTYIPTRSTNPLTDSATQELCSNR